MVTRPELPQFNDIFGHLVELSSEALGGQVVAFSDEFFSPARDLLKVPPALSHKGEFGPNGAIFDGWETRRHNPDHDWVIIKLGPPSGTIVGADIDTAHFSGNEGPAASVAACFLPEGTPTATGSHWQEVVPISPLGPSSRHLFTLDPKDQGTPFTHVKLMMHPDGGIARFRVYGSVIPLFPKELSVPLDLAHSFNGGRVVFVSNQHYGVGSNLLLSGRGKDMGDGWETRRSRIPGHKDYVVIKLGAPGYLDWTEIDTAHFLGNFPESCDLYATSFDGEIPPESAPWNVILPRTKLGPHRQHCFQLEQLERPTTHVRMTIYPDGGVKRIRLVGRRAGPGISPLRPSTSTGPSTTPNDSTPRDNAAAVNATSSPATGPASIPTIPALPLTAEAFAPYGHVIQAYPNPHHAPKGVRVTPANFGSALKFNHLSPVASLVVPGRPELKQSVNFSVYHCTPTQNLGGSSNDQFKVQVLERHEFSSQSFVPMTSSSGGACSNRYLIIVALPESNRDGRPDLTTLRAFTATTLQGFSYLPNVWHHPMIALDEVTDFACITNETGDPKLDCEVLEFGKTVALVQDATR